MSIRYILQLVGVFFYVMGGFPLLWAQEKEKVKLEYSFKPGDEIFYTGEIRIDITGDNLPSGGFDFSAPLTFGIKVLKVNPDGSALAYYRIRTMLEKLNLHRGKKADLEKIYEILYTSGFLPEEFVVARLTKDGNSYYAGKTYSGRTLAMLPPEPLAPGEEIHRTEYSSGALISTTWELKSVKVKGGNRIAFFNLLREIGKKNYGPPSAVGGRLSFDIEFDMDSSTLLSLSGISVVSREALGHKSSTKNTIRQVAKIRYKKVDLQDVDSYTRWGEIPDVFLNPGERWTVGYAESRRMNDILIEYVPRGAEVYSWRDMLTVRITSKFSQGVIKPEDVLKYTFIAVKKKCPGVGYNILERNSNSVIYECFFPRKCMGEKFDFSEHDIGRIIVGKERIHVIIYATKDIPVSPERRLKIVDFLKHIKLSNE